MNKKTAIRVLNKMENGLAKLKSEAKKSSGSLKVIKEAQILGYERCVNDVINTMESDHEKSFKQKLFVFFGFKA